ncbi:hypothetical protein NPX13_g18 [Xylaria arbuscula]|uniref:Uncharacterized protein n=1 Tax=Xylaria arbuscula TaxID=114810 RepID=A0A9W8TRF8_9PEZI|nr:hypothetical protein NPX13_g18 [Xylaria arbuscula]
MQNTQSSHTSIFLLVLVVISQWLLSVQGQGETFSCCTGDDCDADDEGLELNEVQASPTADMSPGIGVEFETNAFTLLGNPPCTEVETFQLKGKVLGGRKGDSWQLTVDTTLAAANQLQAEYILDGLKVKLGQGTAGPAAAAIAADLLDWNPTMNSPGMTVDGLDGCTWSISAGASTMLAPAARMQWQRQITTPLPLEALHDIIGKARPDYMVRPISLLPDSKNRAKPLIYVSTEFFQSSPEGAPAAPTSDVLGFFSLVLSYVKAADFYQPGESPKFRLPIMPRNDFQSMFNLIKGGLGSSLDAGDSTLYNIVKTLACYTWYVDGNDYELEIDSRYCDGNLASPVVGTKVDDLKYSLTGGTMNPPPSFTIKEWMDDLQANKGDRMSAGDKTYDGQIGGFGDKMEYALGTTRLVPLFEFRNLGSSTSSQFEMLVTQAENDIISYHHQYGSTQATAKSKRGGRRVHRQLAACSANMTSTTASTSATSKSIFFNTPSRVPSMSPSRTPSNSPSVTSFITSTIESTTPSITPYPTVSCYLQNQDPDQGITSQYCVCENSITAPILEGSNLAQTALCVYTTVPGTTAEVSVPTYTWTTNCNACTLIGGIADSADCTMVDGCTPTGIPTSTETAATPTMTAFVANLHTVEIGDAEDGNGGKDLAKYLFTELRSHCNDTACDAGASADMNGVETILNGGEISILPTMFIDDARYHNDIAALERMLLLGISSWVAALNNEKSGLCQDVEYEADSEGTFGCGDGPIPLGRLRRTVRRDTGEVLWEREDLALQERCLDFCDAPSVCNYKGRVCKAPASVHVVMAGDGNPYKYELALSVVLEKVGGSGFSCDEIVLEVTEFLQLIAPELVPAEIAGEVGFEALCGAIDELTGYKPSS